MIFTVPCVPNGSAAWTQRSALDGVDFIMEFRWSQRDGHWYFSINDANGVPIVTGRSLTTGMLLLRGVIDPRRPVGELAIVDGTQVNNLDPGFSDLGSRFLLIYADAAELGR